MIDSTQNLLIIIIIKHSKATPILIFQSFLYYQLIYSTFWLQLHQHFSISNEILNWSKYSFFFWLSLAINNKPVLIQKKIITFILKSQLATIYQHPLHLNLRSFHILLHLTWECSQRFLKFVNKWKSD